MTLAELLVALTLLGMLSVMMMGGLHFGGRAWERTRQASDQINAVVRTHAFLRARLSQTARPASVSGESDRLAFDALWMTALGGADFYQFHLALRDDALVLSWRPAPRDANDTAPPPEALTGERVLLKGVTALKVAWFGQAPGSPTPEWTTRWQPDWPAAQLVRIEVALADPRRHWPTLTVGLPG